MYFFIFKLGNMLLVVHQLCVHFMSLFPCLKFPFSNKMYRKNPSDIVALFGTQLVLELI